LHIIGNIEKIRRVKKAGLFHANFDKGRLHARKDPHNFAFIKISCYTPFLFSFHEEFRQSAVLHNSDTTLLGCGVDKDFSLHRDGFIGAFGEKTWGWRDTGSPGDIGDPAKTSG
jgi:hypothetical protein